ncbi:MAG: rod shape-determining protein MreC [Chthonomonadales bacterium]|nr:rod shape-determining protein MreC [Chthonomonadales bacterium]
MLRNDQGSKRNRTLAVVLCVLVGATLGVWHNRAQESGRPDGVTSAVRFVVVPFVQATLAVSRWGGRQVGWLFRGRGLARENRRLHSRVEALEQEVARLRETDATARRLRSQLGFRDAPPGPKLAADVVSFQPSRYVNSMLIARGTRSGVRVGSVVVAPEGLVGHVYDVAPNSASVLLITDTNAAVGALVQRPQSRVAGVCRGLGNGLLTMVYVNRDADVRVGDTIISSGLGGEKAIYPKGIVIGTVTSASNDLSGSSRRVTVRPAVRFDHLEEAYVLP